MRLLKLFMTTNLPDLAHLKYQGSTIYPTGPLIGWALVGPTPEAAILYPVTAELALSAAAQSRPLAIILTEHWTDNPTTGAVYGSDGRAL